jgi:hypothetical protein
MKLDDLKQPLRHVPLDYGNKLAWWLFLVACGFGLGWVSATMKLTSQLCWCAV